MSECVYYDSCANADKSCFQCFNYSKLKEIKEKKGLRSRSATNKQKKEGIDFENRGAKQYNRAVHAGKDVARRQIASGALPYALGDMVTEEQLTASLAEFKERGSVNSRGEKTISIQKAWLDKVAEEAKDMNKDFYFLPFSFKNSDTDYVAMEFDMLLSYVGAIQMLIHQNELLRQQVDSSR